MKIVSICLARAASKRILGKNMKLFCGKPLIYYTARLMIQLGFEAYIATNMPEMKEYLKNNFPQINIIDKPEIYAEDIHKTNEELKSYNQNINADVFVYLPCTSPVRDINQLRSYIEYFNKYNFDCMISARFLPDRMYYSNGKPVNFDETKRTFNNSTTPKELIYEESGSVYVFKKELLNNNFFINENHLIMEDHYCCDLDIPDDWEKSEKKYKEILCK